MIQVQLKLRLNKVQEQMLEKWIFHLTSVWNWGIRKIELDARDRIYHSEYEFKGLLSWHSKKLEIPGDTLSETLKTVYISWQRYFKKKSGKPKFKGNRNKLNSIPFRKIFKVIDKNHISIQGFSKPVRFHKQEIPKGNIKIGRIIKRASGWYLCLVIDCAPNSIPLIENNIIGIDPGFSTTITTSSGEKINQPKEFSLMERRLAQAQRGRNKVASIMQERIKNRRKDNNHKLSRKLISKNKLIVFSKDNIRLIAKRFGKSVTEAGHYQLRSMLMYKCRAGGRQYIEVPSKNSTLTCSNCEALTGPTGLRKLAVRFWECSACGAHHDRDINAAMNTLKVGLGMSHGSETV